MMRLKKYIKRCNLTYTLKFRLGYMKFYRTCSALPGNTQFPLWQTREQWDRSFEAYRRAKGEIENAAILNSVRTEVAVQTARTAGNTYEQFRSAYWSTSGLGFDD